jgi:hypothetical protein
VKNVAILADLAPGDVIGVILEGEFTRSQFLIFEYMDLVRILREKQSG